MTDRAALHESGGDAVHLREEVELLREAVRLLGKGLPGPAVSPPCMRELLDALPLLAFCCDVQGRLHTVNRRFIEISQLREGHEGASLAQALPDATAHELLVLLGRVCEARAPRNAVVPTHAGLFQCVMQPRICHDGTVTRVLCVGHDVSGIMRGNRDLVETLVGASPVATFLLDGRCNVLGANASAASLMLWPDGRCTEGDCFRFLPEGLAVLRRSEVLRSFETGLPREFEDTQDSRMYHHYLRPVPDEDGHVAQLAFYSLDVTAQRQVEQDLRATVRLHATLAEASSRQFDRQSALLDRVFDEVPAGICLFGVDGRVLHVNRAMAEVCGAPEADLVGRDGFTMLHPEDRATAWLRFAADLDDESSDNIQRPLLEYRFLRPDGTVRECQVASAMLRDSSGPLLGMAVVTDVTELRRIKAEAARVGQLATIGELAAGVAHEINSPANAIINCADLIIEDVADHMTVQDIARRIRSEGQRVAAITHNLLAFARDRKPGTELVDIGTVLRDSLALTAAQMRAEGIDVQVRYPAAELHVLGRARELQQVFLNLVSNARHALNDLPPHAEDRKRLCIEARLVGDAKDARVQVVFSDSGTGIAPSIRDRVIEPFFTTKAEGCGTGLGLSISNTIIENHGGGLRLESDGVSGTCAIVELPYASDDGDA